MMQLRRLMTVLAVALLVGASASAATFNIQDNKAAQAQPAAADPISGKYEGVAKTPQGDIALTVELKNDGGKLTGKFDTAMGPAAISKGTFTDGKVMLQLDFGGNVLNVTGTLKDDKITGEWELAGQTGAFELKKVGAAGAAPATTTPATTTPATTTPAPQAAPAPGGDPISGVWEAAADAQGTSIPFTLTLKLEGEKVTGDSASAQGSLPISKGSWAGNKLSLSLETPNGPIVLTATIKEGKLVGEFDFASQFQGRWEAKKK